MPTHHFLARNVNDAFARAVTFFNVAKVDGNALRRRVARNGQATLEISGVVTTEYTHPRERVLFHPLRNANPFFHFFEALWILAGRNDVQWLSHFLPKMAQYSDDGHTFHGAYGMRLRGIHNDQLDWAVKHLRASPDSRRCVLTMFMHLTDQRDSKDIPCNLMLNFAMRDGKLDLTVFNRSNDMVWGAYGANVVQFSSILEFVAGCLRVPVGTYYQISNNFHVYEDEPTWQRFTKLSEVPPTIDPYVHSGSRIGGVDIPEVKPYDMIEPHGRYDCFERWTDDLDEFMQITDAAITDEERIECQLTDITFPYFAAVAVPLFNAFQHHKQGDIMAAIEAAQQCAASDWRVACQLWLNRIRVKREQEQAA